MSRRLSARWLREPSPEKEWRGTPYAAMLAGLLALLLFLLAVLLPQPVRAEGLDCPQTGTGGIPALAIGEGQILRMTTGNDVDLGNEIAALIADLKSANPALSNDTVADTLIAAYCPVVARMQNASAAQKWRLVRQFDHVLMQQIAASGLPQGTLIVATIPLPPAVYQALSRQARAAGKTATDLMAAILTQAAGQ